MFIGTGTTVTIGGGSVAEILDVGPPGTSRESIDTTHMGTAVAKTFLPSKLYDGGELTLSIAFDPTVSTYHTASTVQSVVITFPDSGDSVWTFDAFVTGYKPTDPLEDKATAELTLKVSGAIDIT